MIRKSQLAELIYERITQMLFDGLFPPGTPIVRKDLAEMMKVSPTPVGEAIARLVGDGIVERSGSRGYRVREFGLTEMESLFAVRAGLEGIAVRLCIENAEAGHLEEITSCFDAFQNSPPEAIDVGAYTRADQRFHRLIIEHSGNPYIVNYNRSGEFLLRCYQKGLLRSPADTVGEHSLIIQAIRRAEAVVAQERMIAHHMATRAAIQTMMGL